MSARLIARNPIIPAHSSGAASSSPSESGSAYAVAAVVVVAGEARVWAEILATATTIDAHAASLAQPCDPDSIALLEPSRADAAFVHDAYNFVTGNYSRMARRQIAFGDVKVCAAHAASAHAHPNFTWAGLWNWRVEGVERIRFDRRGLFNHHPLHRN